MPFKLKAQMKKCFAAKSGDWDCKKWAKETPDIKALPKKLKKGKRNG